MCVDTRPPGTRLHAMVTLLSWGGDEQIEYARQAGQELPRLEPHHRARDVRELGDNRIAGLARHHRDLHSPRSAQG